jgi:hypothetical protein
VAAAVEEEGQFESPSPVAKRSLLICVSIAVFWVCENRALEDQKNQNHSFFTSLSQQPEQNRSHSASHARQPRYKNNKQKRLCFLLWFFL